MGERRIFFVNSLQRCINYIRKSLNERIIELNVAPEEFWGMKDIHLETLKQLFPKLKIVARGNTVKAFGEKEILDEFEKQFQRLVVHFTRFNSIDTNVIERI